MMTPIGDAALLEAIQQVYPAPVPAVAERAVARAREKLGEINAREGRTYGQDGYGDDYMRKLAVEEYGYMVHAITLNTLSKMINDARRAPTEGE